MIGNLPTAGSPHSSWVDNKGINHILHRNIWPLQTSKIFSLIHIASGKFIWIQNSPLKIFEINPTSNWNTLRYIVKYLCNTVAKTWSLSILLILVCRWCNLIFPIGVVHSHIIQKIVIVSIFLHVWWTQCRIKKFAVIDRDIQWEGSRGATTQRGQHIILVWSFWNLRLLQI
jgi:hypothetical protein